MKKWSVEAPSNRSKYLLLIDDAVGHVTSKVDEQQATDSVLTRGEAEEPRHYFTGSELRDRDFRLGDAVGGTDPRHQDLL